MGAKRAIDEAEKYTGFPCYGLCGGHLKFATYFIRIGKNDRKNSGGTLRQKFNLIDI